MLQLILLNQHWSDPRRLVIAARQRLRTIVPYHVMRLAAETFDFKIEAPALSLALGTGSGKPSTRLFQTSHAEPIRDP